MNLLPVLSLSAFTASVTAFCFLKCVTRLVLRTINAFLFLSYLKFLLPPRATYGSTEIKNKQRVINFAFNIPLALSAIFVYNICIRTSL